MVDLNLARSYSKVWEPSAVPCNLSPITCSLELRFAPVNDQSVSQVVQIISYEPHAGGRINHDSVIEYPVKNFHKAGIFGMGQDSAHNSPFVFGPDGTGMIRKQIKPQRRKIRQKPRAGGFYTQVSLPS